MLDYMVSAIIFKESPHTAVAAFDALVSLPASQRAGLESTAVVQRDERGQIKFVQTRYWTARPEASMGGLLGLIIGIIFSGPVVGLVAGLGLGAFLGNALGRGLSQTFIDNIQNNLAPGDTVLIALQTAPNDALLTPFVPAEGELYVTTLTVEVTSALRQALAGYTD